jgi:glyoxylase-like metal-dependent hydrolase (beta-lactamase superfamily II)
VTAAGTDATWEVTAVRYATLASTRDDLYYRWAAYGEPDGPQSMDYFFYLLRSGEETIVVDSGFAPAAGARRGRTCLTEPAEALRALGVDAAAVERVLVTHLHYDHIGNLELFTGAQLLVPERELAFWTSAVARNRQFWMHAEEAEVAHVAAAHAAGRVTTYGGQTEIAPGITAIEVGGHSPGQQVLVVQSAGGPVVLTSDAVHLYEELEQDRPFGVLADLAEMYEAFSLIRRLGEQPGAVVVPGHDPEVTRRFAALPGVPEGLALRIA